MYPTSEAVFQIRVLKVSEFLKGKFLLSIGEDECISLVSSRCCRSNITEHSFPTGALFDPFVGSSPRFCRRITSLYPTALPAKGLNVFRMFQFAAKRELFDHRHFLRLFERSSESKTRYWYPTIIASAHLPVQILDFLLRLPFVV